MVSETVQLAKSEKLAARIVQLGVAAGGGVDERVEGRSVLFFGVGVFSNPYVVRHYVIPESFRLPASAVLWTVSLQTFERFFFDFLIAPSRVVLVLCVSLSSSLSYRLSVVRCLRFFAVLNCVRVVHVSATLTCHSE